MCEDVRFKRIQSSSCMVMLLMISRIILIYFCKYCNFFDYSTRYLLLGRQRVAKESSSLRFFMKNCLKINFLVEYLLLD